MTVKGAAGKRELTVVASQLVTSDQAMVSSSTLAHITPPVPAVVQWLSVPDRSRAVAVMVAVNGIVESADRVSGSVVEAAFYEQMMDILLAITTGLLAVAVLIALIGVSNTLGLSVVERTRESALLRALGLQARSLRVMLLIEAVQVALVGIVVGVVAGAGFGWLCRDGTGPQRRLRFRPVRRGPAHDGRHGRDRRAGRSAGLRPAGTQGCEGSADGGAGRHLTVQAFSRRRQAASSVSAVSWLNGVRAAWTAATSIAARAGSASAGQGSPSGGTAGPPASR